MKHVNYLRSFSYWIVFGILPQLLPAQTDFICDGEPHQIPYTGTFQDILVPDDPGVTQIEITAKGGDGGFAMLDDDCFSNGGAGASLSVIFTIGNGPDDLRPGSTLRFIVGQAGEKGTGGGVLGTGFTYGGGGGGTGILYKATGSNDWVILAVAGGGGGAYQGRIVGFCIDSEEGQGGRAGHDGGDGNGDLGIGQGGPAGFGGVGGSDISGGGGGAYGDGTGILCIDFSSSTTVGEGQAGFPAGGIGGGSEGCVSFTFRNGGYGFGAGGSGIGAGGGGGGFGGGGGGGTTGRGGGGGSYIHIAGQNANILEGGSTPETEDGYATYRCIKRSAPVAVCAGAPVVLSLDDAGNASLNPAQLDGGSSHPDGLELTLTADHTTFTCAQLGDNTVTLTVSDPAGASATCTAVVSVQDLLAPQISGPAVVSLPCNSSESLNDDTLVTASDNCDSTPSLTYTDELIDGDCTWACTIKRTWVAKDQSGNQYTFVQTLERTPGELIETALSLDIDNDGDADPLVMGFSVRTLRFEAGAADCLQQWLPGSATPTAPLPVPSGGQVINGSNCTPGYLGFDAQGRLTNPLLSQSLMLALKLRANPALASMRLSDFPCSVPPVFLQALSPNPKLSEILTVSNYALANLMFISHQAQWVEVLACINSHLDFCTPITDGSDMAPLAIAPEAQTLRAGQSRLDDMPVGPQPALNVFPNPARNQAYIDLSAFEGRTVVLHVFNQQGMMLQQIEIQEAPATWPLRLEGLETGLLAVTAHIEGVGMRCARIVVSGN